MSTTDDKLTKSSSMRTLLIALVPALLVFIVEEATKPYRVAAAPVVKEAPIAHVLKRTDWDIISGFVLTASTMISDIGKVTVTPQTSCLSSVKTGILSYTSSMLGLLQQEMHRSLSMKNADDEALINGNVAVIAKTMLEAVPVLDVTLSRLEKSCAGQPESMMAVRKTRIMLDKDLSPYLRDVQQRTLPKN